MGVLQARLGHVPVVGEDPQTLGVGAVDELLDDIRRLRVPRRPPRILLTRLRVSREDMGAERLEPRSRACEVLPVGESQPGMAMHPVRREPRRQRLWHEYAALRHGRGGQHAQKSHTHENRHHPLRHKIPPAAAGSKFRRGGLPYPLQRDSKRFLAAVYGKWRDERSRRSSARADTRSGGVMRPLSRVIHMPGHRRHLEERRECPSSYGSLRRGGHGSDDVPATGLLRITVWSRPPSRSPDRRNRCRSWRRG